MIDIALHAAVGAVLMNGLAFLGGIPAALLITGAFFVREGIQAGHFSVLDWSRQKHAEWLVVAAVGVLLQLI